MACACMYPDCKIVGKCLANEKRVPLTPEYLSDLISRMKEFHNSKAKSAIDSLKASRQ